MKRIISVVIALLLVLSFAACKRIDETDTASSSSIQSDNTVTSSEENISSEEAVSSETVSSEEPSSVASVPSSSVPTSSVASSKPVVAPAPKPPVSNDPLTITYTPKTVNAGKTYTGLPVLPVIQYTLNDPNNTRGLSAVRNGFSFGVAKNGAPHSITVNNQKVFDGYNMNALAWDNKTEGKVLYLTFDCGYKFQNLTERLLNTLKEKNVKAAFFCTLDYLEDDPAAVCRMISEGHIVGNHSTTHPDFTTINRERMAKELLGAHNFMRVNYGYDSKYFRFPTGAFSQSALDVADQMGYRSAFWSVAYADWDPAGQDTSNAAKTEEAYNTVISRLHPGAVILLHSTSPYNVANLGKIIDYAISQGYEFRSLDEYGFWK